VIRERKIKNIIGKNQEKEDLMKKLGTAKLFALLVVLSAALVFGGINSIKGKKPPKWDWKIEIPTYDTAQTLLCSVYGNSPTYNDGYAVFEENDYVNMTFESSEDSNTGDIIYHLWLKIYNTNKDIDDPGDYSIGFCNLAFAEGKTYCEYFYEGDPPCPTCCCCVFPHNPEGTPCYSVDGCTGPNCFGAFMNGYRHPSFGYEYVVMRMYIYCDTELLPGESATTEARMWQFDIQNTTAPLPNGNDDYHNIYHPYQDQLLEDVTIERSEDGNTWTVFVNQDGTPSSLYPGMFKTTLFREFYYQGVYKEKGKSGKYVLESEDRIVLGARTPFRFMTKWTRF